MQTRTAVTLPCIHTELQYINFADLFSTGFCLCAFHLNCTFVPGSCEKHPSVWGLAMSTCFVLYRFLKAMPAEIYTSTKSSKFVSLKGTARLEY